MKIVFPSPHNGDYYCDGMLTWDQIIDALQPAIDAGIITVTHEQMFGDAVPKAHGAFTE